MKKLAFLFLLLSLTVSAQNELSYGVLVGGNYYQSANSGGNGFDSSDDYFSPNLGGYLEYNFSNNMGLKTEITYHKKNIVYYMTGSKIQMSFIEISPNFKYDFGQEYRKGFYLIVGPKLSLITKATSGSEDVKDTFETSRIGAQLGIGQRIAKYIDIQAKFDYELTPFIKVDNTNSSRFFGVNLSVNIDLQRMINQ